MRRAMIALAILAIPGISTQAGVIYTLAPITQGILVSLDFAAPPASATAGWSGAPLLALVVTGNGGNGFTAMTASAVATSLDGRYLDSGTAGGTIPAGGGMIQGTVFITFSALPGQDLVQITDHSGTIDLQGDFVAPGVSPPPAMPSPPSALLLALGLIPLLGFWRLFHGLS